MRRQTKPTEPKPNPMDADITRRLGALSGPAKIEYERFKSLGYNPGFCLRMVEARIGRDSYAEKS